MKKPTLYLLLFALLFSLVSCLNTGNGTETTTDSENESETTTPAESESTTPDESESDPIPDDPEPNPFSNGIEIESIVAVDYDGSKGTITNLTTLSEITKMFPKAGLTAINLSIHSTALLKDEEGGMILLDYGNQKLYHYPQREAPTHAEFKQIKEGMLFLEAVTLLKCAPDSILNSSGGHNQASYYSSDDTVLRISLGVNEELGNIVDIDIGYVNRYHEEALLPASQVSASQIAPGMQKQVVLETIMADRRIDWGEYILFRDQDGKSVIVTFGEDDTVTEVTVYAPPVAIPTSEDVIDMKNTGATIFDYVEAFGLPYKGVVNTKGCFGISIMTTTGGVPIGAYGGRYFLY